MANSKDPKAALKESENRFRILFNSIEDSIIMFEVLPDGTLGPIRDVNKPTCTRLGYTRKELLKMTILDIERAESITCETSAKARYSDSETLFEAYYQAKNGIIIPVEINARKFEYEGRTMILAIAKDTSTRKDVNKIQEKHLKKLEQEIAERTSELETLNASLEKNAAARKKAESKATEAEKDFQRLIDTSHQSIFMINTDGTAIYVNKAIAKTLNSNPDELIGKNIFDYLPASLAESRQKQIMKVIETKQPLRFMDVRSGKPILHTVSPVLENNKVVRMAIYAEDLTEIQHKERELEQSRHIQSVLYEILSHSHSSNNLDELLESIHGIMIKELKAENFFIALIDEERELLKFEYCIDKITPTCPTVYNINDPENKQLSLLPIRENRIIHLSRENINKMLQDNLAEIHGTVPEVWLGVPLRVRGNVIGLLVIQDYDTQSFYSEEDIQLFAACSDQIALSIERKRFDQILKSNSDTFHNIPSGLFIFQQNAEGKTGLLDANPAAERISGVSLKENKGRSISDIWPQAVEQKIHDKFITPLNNGKEFISGKISYSDLRISGTYRLHSFTLPDKKIGLTFEDITKQQNAEKAVRESEEQFRALFEDNHSVMFIIAPETGSILNANKAAEKFYGINREVLVTKHIQEFNALSQGELYELMNEATAEKKNHFIFKHKISNGDIRDVEVFSGPFKFKGKTRLISIVHDITARLKNEKDLSEAKEAAVLANKAKDEFLANISHEIRTPLNGVMGMLQLMQCSQQNEHKNNIDIALQSSKNLLRVLDDILDLSKIEAGTLTLYKDPFLLQGLLDECLNLFKYQAEEKNINLACSILSDAEGNYIGDEGRIRQILFNLLGNALKFTESGSVKLLVHSMPGTELNKNKLLFQSRIPAWEFLKTKSNQYLILLLRSTAHFRGSTREPV